MYGAGPYLAAQALVEMVYVTPQALIYTIITYTLMRAPHNAGAFFYVLSAVWLGCMVSFLMMQAIAQALHSANLVSSARAILTCLQMLTNGFMQPLPGTAKAWSAAYMLSPHFYLFQAVASGLLWQVDTVIEGPDGERITIGGYVKRLYGVPGSSFPGPHGSLGMLVALGAAFAAISLLCARLDHARRRC